MKWCQGKLVCKMINLHSRVTCLFNIPIFITTVNSAYLPEVHILRGNNRSRLKTDKWPCNI